MAVCPLILIFLHISSQKWLVFVNYFSLPNFLPQQANFFTRIYPSYPWHFPTLTSDWIFDRGHATLPCWNLEIIHRCWLLITLTKCHKSLLLSRVSWSNISKITGIALFCDVTSEWSSLVKYKIIDLVGWEAIWSSDHRLGSLVSFTDGSKSRKYAAG